MARPVEWTAEKKVEAQAYICQQIALGRSLVKICEEPDMPSYWTVMQWRAKEAEFSQNYARAREDQADFYAEEIIDIADEEKDANLARVRIDARKWKAGKLKPKVYGDRLNLDQDLTVRIEPAQRRARIEQLMAKAANAGLIGVDGDGTRRTSEASGRGRDIPEADEAVQSLPGFRPSEA